MRNQTTKKAPFNRGNEETNNALRSIWLRGLDSNQRPSGYTLPEIFISVWTISSSIIKWMQGAI